MKKAKKNWKKIAATGVLFAGAVGVGTYWKIKQAIPSYTVLRVIDGDTFETSEKQLVRLAHVFAPEVKYCGGPEAKAGLEKLIMGRPVYFKVIFRDKYMRLISLVYTDKTFVNLEMVKNGLAIYSLSGPKTGETEVLAAAKEKMRNTGAGLYGEPCTQSVNRQNPKCNIKGNNRDGGTTSFYHYPGCGQYNNTLVQLYVGDRWFCSEAEAAKAGYKKGPLCP